MATEPVKTQKQASCQKEPEADELAKKIRAFAEKLHKQRIIYLAFGCLDGLSLSYSTLKYIFDIYLTDSPVSTSDYMHDWMVSPEGIALTAMESIFIIAFSMMGNYFEDDDQNVLKRYAAILWPYCRDVLKASKNAYKGWRSMLHTIQLLGGGQNLNVLLLPVSLTLGAVGIMNRLWNRKMVNERKEMMQASKKLYEWILEQNLLSEKKAKVCEEAILSLSQSTKTRTCAFLSAALGGAIDSLYLYMGIVFLASVSQPIFIFIVAASFVFALSCIVARVYEEYEYQRLLIENQEMAKLALFCKTKKPELIKCNRHLQEVKLKLLESHLSEEDRSKLYEQRDALFEQVNQIEEDLRQKRKALNKLIRPSYISAFLMGVRHGLAAYSMIASVLFAVATILLLASVSFPPALLLAIVAIGVVTLLGFIGHALYINYQNRPKDERFSVLSDRLDRSASEEIEHVQQLLDEDRLNKEIEDDIKAGAKLDPSPQFYYQEWFEVMRSFFSGLGKGSKSTDYTLNPLQEQDDEGHYHDTPIMLGVTIITAAVYSLTLAVRALTRGFGKEPPGILRNIDKIHAAIPKSKSEPDLRRLARGGDDNGSPEPLSQSNPLHNSPKKPFAKAWSGFFQARGQKEKVQENNFGGIELKEQDLNIRSSLDNDLCGRFFGSGV